MYVEGTGLCNWCNFVKPLRRVFGSIDKGRFMEFTPTGICAHCDDEEERLTRVYSSLST